MNEFFELSARALAARISDGSASARDVVDAHIDAIERVNPTLNAVVATRYDEARREADEADDRVRRGEAGRGPFHGVPCTIKESFALSGMPHTSGLPRRVGRPAQGDATAVARMRSAGLIPLGVTNTSELCMWMETNNRVYGRTNNPYDASRIVGGSSGGEGAIVGAGASPIGLGADVGGSIRMPAFFCGAFGHKPTGGLIPNTGQWPIAENEALRYLTTGPITRRAEDIWPYLKALAGPDGEDEGCQLIELGDPADVDLAGLQVITVADNGRTRVSPELKSAQRLCADHLANLGARVREIHIDDLSHSFEIWGAMMEAAGGTPFRELLGEGEPISLLREFLGLMVGRSDHTLPALVLALGEKFPALRGERGARLVQRGRQLQLRVEAEMGDGVMLYPSYSCTAPPHFGPLRRPFDWVYTAIINVLELPATQVPLGLDQAGLPLGVQVIARRGADHRTVAVALEFERAFGGWVPPPNVPTSASAEEAASSSS